MLFVLAGAAVFLTIAMIGFKQMMLGPPCAIFWAILGGYAYQESTATWDMEYFLFFASMAMAIFSLYAMYGVRPRDLSPGKEEWDDTESYADEGNSEGEPASESGGGDIEKDEIGDERRKNREKRRDARRRVNAMLRRTGKG